MAASLDDPRDDESFLDDIFDQAIALLTAGAAVASAEIAAARPHLRSRVLDILHVAEAVARRPAAPRPTLAGYEILEELGRGAMGTVWLARQRTVGGRPVALKVLSPGAALAPEFLRRFLAEARVLGRLSHPNIVAVHDVVDQDGVCAFAMERIEGGTLAGLIARLRERTRPPDLEQVREHFGSGAPLLGAGTWTVYVARAGAALARALDAVHRARLLHRDVKPSNILLRRDGTPLLSDFGLALDPDAAQRTQSGLFVGTPAYAAPEQLRGDHGGQDARTDVYGLGATLYEALTLERPFVEPSAARSLAAIEAGRLRPLRRLAPHVPRDLETIVLAAMDPDPARRYATAAALAEDLERVLSLQPIAARPAGPFSRGLKLVRRHRRILSAAAAGILLGASLVIAFAGGAEERRRAGEKAQALRFEALGLLLRPDLGEEFFSMAYWQSEKPSGGQGRRRLEEVLARYDAAIGLDPPEDLAVVLRAERDLVADTMVADRDTPKLTGEELQRLSSRQRRDLGFQAFIRGDAALCSRAWSGLGLGGEADPVVDAALGELHLARDEAVPAALHLLAARQALPGAGFLWVDFADAALRCGQVDAAEEALRVARTLPALDSHDTLLRVEADLLAARGRFEEALPIYAGICHERLAPTARLHWARALSASGAAEKAIGPLLGVWRHRPKDPDVEVRLRKALQSWWSELDGKARFRVYRHLLEPADPDSVAFTHSPLGLEPPGRGHRSSDAEKRSMPVSDSSPGKGRLDPFQLDCFLEDHDMPTVRLQYLPRPIRSGIAALWHAGMPRGAKVLVVFHDALIRASGLFAGLRKPLAAALMILIGLPPAAPAQPPANAWTVSFDGVDDYGSVPYHPSMAFGTQGTMEVWVTGLSTDPAAYARVIWKRCDPVSELRWVTFGDSGVPGIGAGTGSWAFCATVDGQTPAGKSWSPTTNWFHVAAVHDGGTSRFYVNGRFLAQSTGGCAQGNSSSPWNFGASIDSCESEPDRFTMCRVAALRISNIARYGAQDFLPARTWSPDANDVMNLPFEEGSGAVSGDVSPIGSTCSLNNGVAWVPGGPALAVYSASPAVVSRLAGSTVILDGLLYSGAGQMTVTIGGVPASVVNSSFDTLEVLTPQGMPVGFVDVVVTGPNGTATLVNGLRIGTQPNSSEGSLVVNGIGSAPVLGPFQVGVAPGAPITFAWTGTPGMPIILATGAPNAGHLLVPGLGFIDIGTPPLYADLVLVIDGLSTPPPLGWLFNLGAAGAVSHTFAPLVPPGTFLGAFQGLVLQPAALPALTASFRIDVN